MTREHSDIDDMNWKKNTCSVKPISTPVKSKFRVSISQVLKEENLIVTSLKQPPSYSMAEQESGA